MDLAMIMTKDMSVRKCKCIEKYQVIRAPEYVLQSVLLFKDFWLVEPLSCRPI